MLLDQCKYEFLKNRCIGVSLTTYNFLLMIRVKKILIKKVKNEKKYSRSHLFFTFLMCQMIHFHIMEKELLSHVILSHVS